jgi:type VI secretion system protein ImpE
LRAIVWTPAHLLLENGGEAYALIPSRYPGSETAEDPRVILGRKTEWVERAPGFFCGLGQRVLATDAGEISLMDIREISITAGAAALA